jgi:4-methyl-5(b-hydroxyethyl)-thiazole monophosphate biosynthesis
VQRGIFYYLLIEEADMAHVIILLAEGFEEVEAITVIDLLRRAEITVTTVGLRKKETCGGHGITLLADTTLSHLPIGFDAVILPGGGIGTKNLAASEPVIRLVKKAFEDGIVCAAICAAPSVFGKAGILQNTRATCYPGFEDQLTGALFIEAAVVRDRNVITGRGVAAAIPFALELITRIEGEEAARQVGEKILYR